LGLVDSSAYNIVYNFSHSYPISTYVETIIISVQADFILGLVAKFQQKPRRQQHQELSSSTATTAIRAGSSISMTDRRQRLRRRHSSKLFIKLNCGLYAVVTIWGLTVAPPQLIAVGQFLAAGLNSAALIPQFILNYKTKSKGDYSPVTAGLAALGCAARLFTTATLAGADLVLLLSFALALVLNSALFVQIVYITESLKKVDD
jgi:mannose-P-dolichol utilization defect 1